MLCNVMLCYVCKYMYVMLENNGIAIKMNSIIFSIIQYTDRADIFTNTSKELEYVLDNIVDSGESTCHKNKYIKNRGVVISVNEYLRANTRMKRTFNTSTEKLISCLLDNLKPVQEAEIMARIKNDEN